MRRRRSSAERRRPRSVGARGASLAAGREVLARFRPDATEVAVAALDAPVGRVLLEAAREIGADRLMIGAYAQGPTLEWLLGGVTRTVLREAAIPLFLRH